MQVNICYSKCNSCGTNKIFNYTFQYNSIDFLECQTCKAGSNESLLPPLCLCNSGYYYDGKQCIQQKVGIIYFDDFESPTSLQDNWVKNDNKTMTAILEKEPFGSQSIKFPQQVYGGDIFSKKYYQTLQFDEKYWIFIDYKDNTNQGECLIGYGTNSIGRNEGKHTWTTAIDNTHPGNHIPKTTGEKWGHWEEEIKQYYDVPFNILIENYSATHFNCWIDNFIIASSHGPAEIHESPHSFLHHAVMILSIDYTGYSGDFAQQQFSFNIAKVDIMLGRSDWNGEKFAVKVEEYDVVTEIYLYRNSNGASLGDGYGKLVDNTGLTDKRYFYVGDYLIFPKDFTQNKSNFKLESGMCQYEGPLKTTQQNLENCFDDCLDFETLEAAIQECLKQLECDGVTYSHKNWGGDKSTGFKLGYGYQLRKQGTTPNRQVPRKFEFSWKKRQIEGKFQEGMNVQCSDCDSIFCKYCYLNARNCISCSHSLTRHNPPICDCRNPLIHTGKQECETKKCNYKCLGCATNEDDCISCKFGIGREAVSPCKCKSGYYEIPNQLKCEQCKPECQECENGSSCKSCLNGTYSPPECLGNISNIIIVQGQTLVITCNQKCQTCSNSSNNCLKCAEGINRINQIPECNCKDGYHDNGGQTVDCFECPQSCSKCLSQQICVECKLNKNRYLDYQGKCVCLQGFKENQNLQCQKCYYYQGECLFSCPQWTQADQKNQIQDYKEIQLGGENNIENFEEQL